MDRGAIEFHGVCGGMTARWGRSAAAMGRKWRILLWSASVGPVWPPYRLFRLRRKAPAVIRRPARAPVGSGTAVQLREFPENVKRPCPETMPLAGATPPNWVNTVARVSPEATVKILFHVLLVSQNVVERSTPRRSNRAPPPASEPLTVTLS